MKNSQISSAKQNNAAFLALTVLLAALSAFIGVCAGSVYIPPNELLQAFFGGSAADIIFYARIPRVLGCLLAGSALAVSGAVIQSVLSNPLAAPNVIGVNSGAGFAAALCCALFPTLVELLPIAAFLGALAAVMLVMLIAKRTSASRMTLVLAGVAVSAIFSAGIDSIITFFPDALNGYSDFRIGGMENMTLLRLLPAFRVIALALLAVILLSHELDILRLGEETARSLGLSVRKIRIILLTLAAALAGAAVSFAGLLGFVGLVVPHIVRKFAGEKSLSLIIGSAFGGAALLTFCDTLARVLFAPFELPVGIVLAFIGGPFFIWLLLRQRGGRSHA